MQIVNTFIDGLFVIKPDVFKDDRGFFYEFYNKPKFEKETGLKIDFIQDNLAKSQKGVLRGFHFQKGPFGQSKLISVLQGAVLDVVVDVRPKSPTFGQSFSIELNDQNKTQLFVPKGMAHAYLSLSDDTLFFYKIDEVYHPESEAGIRFDDPDLKIDWQNDMSQIILSEKDRHLPYLKDIYKDL
jgi:dTDP-4-dehydrorhamnose 3,5-epimerase